MRLADVRVDVCTLGAEIASEHPGLFQRLAQVDDMLGPLVRDLHKLSVAALAERRHQDAMEECQRLRGDS